MTRVAPCAAALSAALILWHAARDKPLAELDDPAPLIYPQAAAARSATGEEPRSVTVTTPALGQVAVQQAGVAATIQVIVGRNDTMDAIFRRMALDAADLAAIRTLPGIRQSLDFLKPGDSIEVTHAAGAVRELSRKVSETQTLTVIREDAGFAARIVSNPTETRIRTARATIHSSLFQAAAAANISGPVALKLANVFAWDIDFAQGIRAGDRFTAEYEQIYQNGAYVRDGDVLAAEFVNNGKIYRAVRFVAEDGSASYYTPDGKPMRKAFLRTPVDFIRISSVFNPHRLHPILNLIRGHMGTDYAAPTGTPVHAAGDGRVSFAGRRGGYGNALMLSHSNNVSTLYGHLSRFAAGVHVGSQVRQGEIIGYVGMTGLATGPHLHYEYLVDGVQKDPQTVRLAGAEPLRTASLSTFRAAAAPLLSGLLEPAVLPPAAAAAFAPPAASIPTTAFEPPVMEDVIARAAAPDGADGGPAGSLLD